MSDHCVTTTSENYAKQNAAGLLQLAAELAEVDLNETVDLAQTLLHVPPLAADTDRGSSELNWNGSPLQLLISTRSDGLALRLLADPGFHLKDPLARHGAGRAALSAAFTLAGAESLLGLAERTLEIVAPSDRTALSGYAAGSMWLAAALGTPGAALYVGPDPRSARWAEARLWLSSVLVAHERVSSLLDRLEGKAFLLGVGIEGAHRGAARLKIYWRLADPAPLSSFGIELFEAPSLIAFLTAVLASGPVNTQTLNFSAAFELSSGALHDIKVDVSWDGRTSLEAFALLAVQENSLGLAPLSAHSALRSALERCDMAVGCVGLGMSAAGKHRMNTYLFQH